MKNNKRIGISLIVLVITIIVIVILAGAVILSLASNNPISQATKATYLSDVKNFQTELNLYEAKQFENNLGAYDPKLLQADESSVTYNGTIDTSKSIYDLIALLNKSGKYAGQFQVIDGQLVFQGSDTNKQNWVRELDIEVVIAGEPRINIIAPTETVVSKGTDIIYTIKFTSNAALTTIDLTNKIEVLDNNGVALVTQPVINVGTISGTSAEATRQVDITIKTDSLADGSYKLKIKQGVVTNADNISNSIDVVSLIGFDIDSTPPTNPVMSVNTTDWTNENVLVTIAYSTDSTTKEYSFDGTTWNTYTTPVAVTTNNTTVYAKGKDASGNVSGLSTITVSNIDKTAPVATWGTPSKTTMLNTETVTIPLTFTETNSGIKNSTVNITNVTIQKTGITAATVVLSGSGNNWTATVNGITGTGSFTLTATTGITDNANNTLNTNVISSSITVNEILFSTTTFTNAGATGSYGPTQAQLNTAYASTPLAGKVTSSSGIQVWTVPVTGTYKIETYGASGADGTNAGSAKGGYGAKTVGNFNLVLGDKLFILVGQKGMKSNGDGGWVSGGGGGGTFVAKGTALNTSTALIVAGGGAGGYSTSSAQQAGGYILTTTTTGLRGNLLVASTNGGSTGAGFHQDGISGDSRGLPYAPILPKAFINGGNGSEKTGTTYKADGGFGGAGSGGGNGAGAGGGFIGGDYTPNVAAASTGGTSYNTGASQSNQAGINIGDGKVIISMIN